MYAIQQYCSFINKVKPKHPLTLSSFLFHCNGFIIHHFVIEKEAKVWKHFFVVILVFILAYGSPMFWISSPPYFFWNVRFKEFGGSSSIFYQPPSSWSCHNTCLFIEVLSISFTHWTITWTSSLPTPVSDRMGILCWLTSAVNNETDYI